MAQERAAALGGGGDLEGPVVAQEGEPPEQVFYHTVWQGCVWGLGRTVKYFFLITVW